MKQRNLWRALLACLVSTFFLSGVTVNANTAIVDAVVTTFRVDSRAVFSIFQDTLTSLNAYIHVKRSIGGVYNDQNAKHTLVFLTENTKEKIYSTISQYHDYVHSLNTNTLFKRMTELSLVLTDNQRHGSRMAVFSASVFNAINEVKTNIRNFFLTWVHDIRTFVQEWFSESETLLKVETIDKNIPEYVFHTTNNIELSENELPNVINTTSKSFAQPSVIQQQRVTTQQLPLEEGTSTYTDVSSVTLQQLSFAIEGLRQELIPQIRRAALSPSRARSTSNGSSNDFLPLTGGTLTGSLTGVSATFSGNVMANELLVTGSTTVNGVEYLFPNVDGTDGQVLTTDGVGGLSWTTVSGGSGDNNWTFFNDGAIRLATTTNQVVIGSMATSTQSAFEVIGGAVFDSATSTSFATENFSLNGEQITSLVGPGLQNAAGVLGLYLASTTTDALPEGLTNLYSQWTTIGSDIVFENGFVGIGTTTPASRLDVVATNTAPNMNLSGTHLTLVDSGDTTIYEGDGDYFKYGLKLDVNSSGNFSTPGYGLNLWRYGVQSKIVDTTVLDNSGTTGQDLFLISGDFDSTFKGTQGDALDTVSVYGLSSRAHGDLSTTSTTLHTGALLGAYGTATYNVGSWVQVDGGDSSYGDFIDTSGAVKTASYGSYIFNRNTNTSYDGATKYGQYITSTGQFTGGSGVSTRNYGLYVDTISGADENYAAYFSGNVGIGTSSPYAKLSVTGDFALTGGLYDNTATRGVSGYVLQSTGTGLQWVATSTLGIVSSQEWTDAGSFDYNLESVYVGTSTAITGSPLFVVGTTTPVFRILSTTGDSVFGDGTQLQFEKTGNTTWKIRNAGSTRLIFNGVFDRFLIDGNTGGTTIGSNGFYSWSSGLFDLTTPDTFLFRDGAGIISNRGNNNDNGFRIYSTGNTTDYERFAINTSATNNYVQLAAEAGGTGDSNLNILLTPAGSGSIGIATTTPEYTLTVAGTVGFNGLTALSSSGEALCLTSDKEVRVNTGAQTCIVSSIRFKHDVKDLQIGLATVEQFRPVTYKENETNEERVGLIAEEVEQIDSRLVAHESDGTPRSVRYEEIIPFLIKSVQELSERTYDSVVTVVNNTTNTIGRFVSLFVEKLVVGSAEKPTGITLYDEHTGEPYCFSIQDGEERIKRGECGTSQDVTTISSVKKSDNEDFSTSSEEVVESVIEKTPEESLESQEDTATNSEDSTKEEVFEEDTPEDGPQENTDVVVSPENT